MSSDISCYNCMYMEIKISNRHICFINYVSDLIISFTTILYCTCHFLWLAHNVSLHKSRKFTQNIYASVIIHAAMFCKAWTPLKKQHKTHSQSNRRGLVAILSIFYEFKSDSIQEIPTKGTTPLTQHIPQLCIT